MPEGMDAEMERPATEPWGTMVRLADPDTEFPPGAEFPNAVDDWLAAVTTAWVALVTAGALNRPSLETLPTVVDHVTAVRFVPVIVAVSWRLPDD